jgi:glycosyltransferase involved in cell wall biosynthesis
MASKPAYSIIIPVYNRPDEIDELLESLTHQTVTDFEVLVIEDGSTRTCETIVKGYVDRLNVQYFFKENTGQGFSRNFGFERAEGDWLIVFDSDCVIPADYLAKVEKSLKIHPLDAYGGPDRAADTFTPVQKAISYSMTSLLTTGGIRGNKAKVGTFHPRSFNMGIRREVFEKTSGYIITRKGEDIEFSIRIAENGFKIGLIPDAFVYHKRRTNFLQFFKQLHFFGTARINIGRFYPQEVKLVHFFPSVFVTVLVVMLWAYLQDKVWGLVGLRIYLLYFIIVWLTATGRAENFWVGILSVVAAFVQLTAYGIGFIQEGLIFLLDRLFPAQAKQTA